MKTYICTEVVTYKASNKKAYAAANYALIFKHRLIKGKSPVTDMCKAIKEYCKVLDGLHPKTRALKAELHRSGDEWKSCQITIYSGDPTSMNTQPKAAVIYIAELAGKIDMDKANSGTIPFDQKEGGEEV